VLEQGLTFTVVEAPHPLEEGSNPSDYDALRDFYAIRRVYLGWVPGTDWLHDEIERHFGEDNVWYDVRSRRDATHVGAAGEVAAVILILMGAGAIEFSRKFVGRLGEKSADDIYDWVKQLATERRQALNIEWADGPPDFLEAYDHAELGERVKSELAGLLRVPQEGLDVVGVEGSANAVVATYRLKASSDEYIAEIGRDNILFRRTGKQDRPSSQAI
jgi:hypothetical protein